jgi:NAD(P)-dependent dehydrogenase (short-subunit alcohol dehydrogenase family)
MVNYVARRALLLASCVAFVAYVADRLLQKEYATHDKRRSAILVTGASSGIGRAAALALHAEGFVVYAGVRDEKTAQELRSHGSRMRSLILDVTNADDIDNAFANITGEAQVVGGGRLVGLVNNAGTTYKRPLETAELERVRDLFDVNVIGLFHVTQKFLPLLRLSRGRVINVGSVQGVISMPAQGLYAATKHALEALNDALRQEMAPHGVSVSMVNPGYINTAIRGKGSPAADAELTDLEKDVYRDVFEKLLKKDKVHALYSPACCPMTDEAIVHALTDPYPRTRYYPSTAAVKLGGAFPAWLAVIIIRITSVHPALDRLKDMLLGHFF